MFLWVLAKWKFPLSMYTQPFYYALTKKSILCTYDDEIEPTLLNAAIARAMSSSIGNARGQCIFHLNEAAEPIGDRLNSRLAIGGTVIDIDIYTDTNPP